MNKIKILDKGAVAFIGIMLLIPMGVIEADDNVECEGCSECRIITDTENIEAENDFEAVDVDINVDYFIKAEDAPNVLDDSSIDDVAFITLFSAKDIPISAIKIFISNDEKNWLETEIVEEGIWYSGEKITVREISSNEVESDYYMVRASTIENKIPLAQCVVNIDNAPLRSCDLFELGKEFDGDVLVNREGNGNLISGFSESASSNCHYETMGILYFAAALGVVFDGAFYDPNPYGGVWIYKFKVDAVFDDEQVGFCDRMELFIEEPSGIPSVVTPHTGGVHMDEDLGDAYDEEAELACTVAVACIGWLPLTFAWTGYQVADYLMDRSEPDVVWTRNDAPPIPEASGYCYQYVFIPPETNFQWKYNLEVHDAYPPPDGWSINLKDDGLGRIVVSGTSPPAPEEGDLIAQDVWMSSQAEDWDKNHVVDVPDEDEDVWFHFEYDWTGTYVCPIHHVQIRLNGDVQCEGDVEEDDTGPYTMTVCCADPWSVTEGSYILIGETDTNNGVDESDENNNEVSYEFTVIEGQSPTADAGGPYSGKKGTSIQFDGTGSHDNDEGGESIVQYDWKFFDGDIWHNDIGSTPTHTYYEKGSYTVTLRVHDDEGDTDTDSTSVAVPKLLVIECSDMVNITVMGNNIAPR